MAEEAFVSEFSQAFADEPVSPEVLEAQMLQRAEPIVQRLDKQANEAVSLRREIEQRWIQDLRQFAGIRDGEKTEYKDGSKAVQAGVDEAGRSTIFVNITRPKTNRTEGRLFDILFPADDKNWGVQPTPVPELATVARRAPEEAQKALDQLNAIEAGDVEAPAGTDPAQLREMAEDLGPQGIQAQQEIDLAKRKSEAMAREIDDQLTEARYAKESRDAIGWAAKLGTGVLKGPIVKDVTRKGWQRAANDDGSQGRWQLSMAQEKTRPSAKCVKPWAFFPDPSATDMDDCEYVYERHLPSKVELRKLAKKLKFNPVAVKELLEEGPGTGTGVGLEHLAEIRSLTGESTPVKGRYILWEYHGGLEREEIADLIRAFGGAQAEDRLAQFEQMGELAESPNVIIWFCNGKLLKLNEYYPMDSGCLCYSVFSLEKGEASVLGGIGVPRIMRDNQAALNAAWRMMMDNSALSVGSQILIDEGAVKPAPGDDWEMRAGKVWTFDSQAATASQPFQTFVIPNNQEQIAGIIQLAMSFIDEETAMPRIAEGGGSMEQAAGVAQTVGGLAMLMNAAGVNIRRMVKNWDDDITAPLIERFYDWNMQYSDKEDIKGDMQVEARGTSTLLQREQQAQTLAAITTQWTTHPVLGPMLKAYDTARMTLQAMGINPAEALIPEEEWEQLQKAAADQPEPEDPQWAARKEIAQIQANTAIQTAQMEREVAILRLAETSKTSIEKINADLIKSRETNQSSERKLAAEIGVEQQNKREAQAMGMLPTGSGGAVSMGAEEVKAA